MPRPPIWKRAYLIEPKLQLGITFYFLLFQAGTLATIYFSLKASMGTILQNAASMSSNCSLLIRDNEDSVRSILTTVFVTNAAVVTLFVLVGGILVSHRVVGPFFRFKKVLRQILDGQDPGPIRVRHSDFFSDLIPLLEELQKSRQAEKAKEKV